MSTVMCFEHVQFYCLSEHWQTSQLRRNCYGSIYCNVSVTGVTRSATPAHDYGSIHHRLSLSPRPRADTSPSSLPSNPTRWTSANALMPTRFVCFILILCLHLWPLGFIILNIHQLTYLIINWILWCHIFVVWIIYYV